METGVRAIVRPAGQGGSHAAWQFAALRGLLEATSRRGTRSRLTHEKELQHAARRGRRLARDDSAAESDRIRADRPAAVLGGQAGRVIATLLVGLLTPRVPIGLQQAAITALAGCRPTPDARALLRGWKTYSPTLRSGRAGHPPEPEGLDVLAAFGHRSQCGSLRARSTRPTAAPSSRSRDQETRKPGPMLVFASQSRSRQTVVDSYKPALARKGDPEAGKAVFMRVCAICHRLGDVGVEVGPNLGARRREESRGDC